HFSWLISFKYQRILRRLAPEPVNHFDRFDLLLLPAFFKAIATACFCGLPSFISVLMFELIVFREEPFLRGIETFSCSVRTDREPSALGSVMLKPSAASVESWAWSIDR